MDIVVKPYDDLVSENRELRAENARLQSLIDAANAQEPIYQAQTVGGLWSDVTAENYAKHAIWRIVYARPISAQQSPAVAVPDECCATGESCVYEVCTLNGEQQCKYCGKEHPDMQSPRITEQDAREIAKDVFEYVDARNNPRIEDWEEVCLRGLLAKLNKPDSVGG